MTSATWFGTPQFEIACFVPAAEAHGAAAVLFDPDVDHQMGVSIVDGEQVKALECKSTMAPFCLLDETRLRRRKEDEKRRTKWRGGFGERVKF
ncbi:UDP-N-acetylmuramoyl-L-alanyl-D-glutamate--26-diaminopimelate ligase [Dissostichus eleginoides]|uniref:UDP-N-acetylmuramoyl-L-alanyl-D-glutamate--26-diaminopimelate ligase n=1 Tax=Dissostichus eleginoides TaxID=100907 RepID=A0AAD9C0T0_DISEL|nr:UDP-N-acetylmuramoyl-L-alanyl-D-glutamate--26-diaminopimelate ligase [Dissostichus eleginoides]